MAIDRFKLFCEIVATSNLLAAYEIDHITAIDDKSELHAIEQTDITQKLLMDIEKQYRKYKEE